jgi:hypothetical protein
MNGRLIIGGYGVMENLKRAAEQGNADAQCDLGNLYCDRGDYGEAIKWYTMAAKQNHARAIFNLGSRYYHGQGVPQDFAKTAEYYQRAADLGNAIAQNIIGKYYDEGGTPGYPQNSAKAAEWYLKAAENGDADAQCSLAVMYYNGEGVEQSDTKAKIWLSKAKAQGHETAIENWIKLGW